MSKWELAWVFNEILSKYVFDQTLATDLRIYLIKFCDKIAQICKGDLILSKDFMENIFEQSWIID